MCEHVCVCVFLFFEEDRSDTLAGGEMGGSKRKIDGGKVSVLST